MKIFQYAVLMHPTKEEKEQGKPTIILVPVTTTIAHDANAAILLAGRDIPADQLSNLSRIEVAVRPF